LVSFTVMTRAILTFVMRSCPHMTLCS